jgi:hypothetical protein
MRCGVVQGQGALHGRIVEVAQRGLRVDHVQTVSGKRTGSKDKDI